MLRRGRSAADRSVETTTEVHARVARFRLGEDDRGNGPAGGGTFAESDGRTRGVRRARTATRREVRALRVLGFLRASRRRHSGRAPRRDAGAARLGAHCACHPRGRGDPTVRAPRRLPGPRPARARLAAAHRRPARAGHGLRESRDPLRRLVRAVHGVPGERAASSGRSLPDGPVARQPAQRRDESLHGHHDGVRRRGLPRDQGGDHPRARGHRPDARRS